MSWFSRFRNHFRSDDVSRDIDRELAFHIAERADELMATGMAPENARREARRLLGHVAEHAEQTRHRELFGWVDTIAGDLRYTTRSLRKAPAFAAAAILSIALGIGANTAIFSIIDAVMLKSLPVSHPEELVMIVRSDNDIFTNPLWEAIRDRQDMFDGVFAFATHRFNLASGGQARRVIGSYVSGEFFSTLGVRAGAGRLLAKTDDYRGCPGIIVLSDAFWRSEYAASPEAIGRTLSISSQPFRIVGVADPRFFGMSVGDHPQFFAPLCSEAVVQGAGSELDRRSSWYLQIVGRPKENVTPQQIRTRFAALAPAIIDATLPPNWPVEATAHYKRSVFSVSPAAKGFSDLRSTYKRALYVLMVIVGLVLAVACANVGNLLLARAATRRREMAVRLALGAGRARLIRQLVTESLFLSAVGAILGGVFAFWGSRLLVGLLSHGGDVVSLDLAPDVRVLAFTIGVATLTGLIFGLVPAWSAGRVDPQTAMKAHGRGLTDGPSRFRVAKALVVAQIALSLVLVTGAGLLIGSWRKLATLNPGFRREGVLLVTADVLDTRAPADQRLALFRQMLDRVRAIPGVKNASLSRLTPIGHGSWNEVLQADGFTPKSEDDALSWMNAVSGGYFTTMGIPLRTGRDFDDRDGAGAARVAIVNEAMAQRFFGAAPAIGRRFRIQDGKTWSDPIELVGVVGDTKYNTLRDTAPPIVFVPDHQRDANISTRDLEIVANGSTSSLVTSVTAALVDLNPKISLSFTTIERQIDESTTLTRAIAMLSGFFGALALVLAAIGLYGVMSYTVARRRSEIGVRIALGAERGRVIRMVLTEVATLVIVGVIVGTTLSATATRLVTSFLYGIKANDPATLATSAAVLVAVGLGAAWSPARRAARVDPVAALRED
jgi:putative ABC transport system permease protein